MMRSRLREGMSVAVVAVLVAACGVSESDAVRELESDGYKNAKVTSTGNGAFDFTADNDDGKKCSGTITINKSIGSSHKTVSSMCQ